MSNWKDTVMDNANLFMNFIHDGYNSEEEGADIERFIKSMEGQRAIEIAEHQAEITWKAREPEIEEARKAGIKEVAEHLFTINSNLNLKEDGDREFRRMVISMAREYSKHMSRR